MKASEFQLPLIFLRFKSLLDPNEIKRARHRFAAHRFANTAHTESTLFFAYEHL
jgi:hypothetical protein